MEAARKRNTKHWYMTDREIAASYREAKNQLDQVRVIADLNIRSTLEVCDKLDSLGFDTTRYRITRIHPKDNSWGDEEIRLLFRLREVYNYTFVQIGEALGKSASSCKQKYTRMAGVCVRK